MDKGVAKHMADRLTRFSPEHLRKTWDFKTGAAHRDEDYEEIVTLIRAEYRRRRLPIPEEAPRLLPYVSTPIEQAFHAIWGVGQRLGMIPHRREPAEPANEALIAERWAKVPAEERQQAREAFALLNIPMQENLL